MRPFAESVLIVTEVTDGGRYLVLCVLFNDYIGKYCLELEVIKHGSDDLFQAHRTGTAHRNFNVEAENTPRM